MVGDAIASLGIAAAGTVIGATGRFFWLDPPSRCAIALLVAVEAYRLVRQGGDLRFESTPNDLDIGELSGAMVAVDDVDTVHDLHVWSFSSELRALSAHLVLQRASDPWKRLRWWASG
jgi:cobalt-zinc-cadmium efflux system protein